MKRLVLISILLIFGKFLFSQELTQTIRGTIIDKESKEPIIGATILVKTTNPAIAATSDEIGKFKLQNVPIGRQAVQVSYIGYNVQTINDLQLNSAKEIVLTIELIENAIKLEDIEVTATNKANTNNEMVSVSGRNFSAKETGRYAGSLGDPSRMARNFAGVSGANDQRNDIIIRGNSPLGLLWRMEGIAIPNPNHFGGQGSTGGPVSIINPLILSNSDFLTGAFPAEYGNATSGVFDLRLRNGNNEKFEHTITFGALGSELMTEGPISKKSGSSYLLSYRYSTLDILTGLGVKIGFASIPAYQDANLKLNFVTKKAGVFSVFAIGGKSSTTFFDSKRDSTQFSPANKNENVSFGSKMGIAGIKHTLSLKNNTYIKTSLAATYEGNAAYRDSLRPDKSSYRIGGFGYSNIKGVLSSYLNKKFNAKHTLQVGGNVEYINYTTKDSALNNFDATGKAVFLYNNNFSGTTQLFQAYTQWKYKVNNELSFNTGLHYQYFTLNNQSAVEPRVGVNWNVKPNQVISFGYGLHNQTQLYGFYFYKNPVTNKELNRELKFTQSNQAVLGYDLNFAKNFHFKTETYYQYITNIPVEQKSSSFSLINQAGSFAVAAYKDSLVNTGTAQNYGLEFTLEKFFDKNYYFLVTASLFDSKYKGSDGILRNTAYNGNYVVNALAGFEVKLTKTLIWLVNGKVTVAGGLPYTEIDRAASIANRKQTFKENEAFAARNDIYLKPDVRLGIRKSFKRKLALEGSLDFQNVINRKNVYFRVFDKSTSNVNTVYQNGFFPNFLFRLEF
jgi:hypothetical protein